MSDLAEPPLDLSRLAFDRAPQGAAAKPKRRQSRGRLLARVVLPAVVLGGFLAMIGWAARDLWRTAKPVTIVPVVVRQAEVRRAGTPLFQAAGWVEPRPTPTYVSALSSGVVEELLVVAGQEVDAGEVVARLVSADSELAVRQAEADLSLAEADLAGAEAERAAAEQLYQQPFARRAALAEADATLAEVEGEQDALPARLAAAEARLRFAEQNRDGRQAARGSVSGRLLQEAESEADRAAAALAELRSLQTSLPKRAEALRRRRDALAEQTELRIEESNRLAAAAAAVRAAEARRGQAEVALEIARLRLDRMTLRSPADGRVLAVLAPPGSFVTGQEAQSNAEGSAVVSLYDPAMLQVRADVRLEDVPRVVRGQPVTVETAAADEPIAGRVLETTSAANVQKNTLEVKVALENPPPAVRPEMLVKATFLAPPSDEESVGEEQRERLLVPRRLVEGEGDARSVWLAAAGNVARRQPVTLGEAGTEELIEVSDGLRPTDKLLVAGREGLEDGDRIEITGEDAG
ncbi:efflux RND transporter periplasmic adaptor subunit [Alienimonas californiensis]|uniref:Putative efflux pump membrane fusion protein n=1 Tax=Alienimonas californiensis TaxID=2527989 RepID=A0A517PCR0_9PLAN|nr:HlyD family efflux transporter periplasmic adaptor subunit [Alienimonas californiensis]QDT17168.1 putative efflux pump membrane fusion protein [Alienimonas californiensis]